MVDHLWQYVLNCDPFAKREDVLEIKTLNEWDLLITFKDGRKVIYDTYTNYHKKIYYDNINELTEEQERKEYAYRLQSFMNREHVTQEELADEIGSTQSLIRRYVRGETVPSVLVARRIAKVLRRSLDDFFDRQF